MSAVALWACAAPDDPAGVDSTDRIAVNRIAVNGITSNKLAIAQLSTAALGDKAGNAGPAMTALAATEDGRFVLSYLVTCALKPEQSIKATVGGVVYTFAGGVGVSSSWATSPLADGAAAWVSACMIARVNYFGVPVSLSLRGAAPNIAPTAAEKVAYKVEEGAFWGDIFDLDGDGALEFHACTGRDQLVDPTYGTLPQRVCAAPDSPCGFDVVGDCATVCDKVNGSGAYPKCAGNSKVLTVDLAGDLP